MSALYEFLSELTRAPNVVYVVLSDCHHKYSESPKWVENARSGVFVEGLLCADLQGVPSQFPQCQTSGSSG